MNILPIDEHIPQILQRLRTQKNLVIKATPGAGKTTRLPPELLELTEKEVWVLEPRRIAAISACHRIAQERNWKVGQEIGYQVRFERRMSGQTRLQFLTEALLLKRLASDPELKRVGIVVIDEFHERNIHSDLAIGALKELQELSRPDLKILVMSATIDDQKLKTFLQSDTVDVPGRIYPQEVFYEEKSQVMSTGPAFTQRMSQLIRKALHENSEGDVLCFLPGKNEIDWVKTELEKSLSIAIYPLHGQLPLQQQVLAIEKHPYRKIVLATNVAESSITVDGVTIVVDSGLARTSQLHPKTGFSYLQLSRISLASATQRAGRSARTAPGKVYRAWTKYDEKSMKAYEVPEIFREDLSETLLSLASIGIQHFSSFSWFESPKDSAIANASTFLISTGILEDSCSLTAFGKRIQELPLHPRLSILFATSEEMGIREACEWIAILSETNSSTLSSHSSEENDLFVRWNRDRSKRNVQQLTEQLQNQWRGNASVGNGHAKHLMIQKLFCRAYADRLCRRRMKDSPEAVMVGGRGVALHKDTSVKQSEYFLALELGETTIGESTVFCAMGIETSLAEEEFGNKSQKTSSLYFAEEKNRFFVKEVREWNGISFGSEHHRPALPQEIEGKLGEVLFQKWEFVLQKNPDLAQFVSRLKALEKTKSEFPSLTEAQIREGCTAAAYLETSLDSIYSKDLVSYFLTLLPADHRSALEKECPSSWKVPSGSTMRIQYSDEQGPFVEVRLQELFGLENQPIINGKPLTLFLLAPNFRPVQVTKDLSSFWKTGYQEVRKELRTRYPKHPWPEDPLQATPQAIGRPRR